MKKFICSLTALVLAALSACASGGADPSVSGASGGGASGGASVMEESASAPAQSGAGTASNVPAANSGAPDIGSLDNKKYCWGQGYNCNEKNQPLSCIEYNEKFSKYGGLFLTDREDSVCLTFDEGYENGYTAAILDTLKEKSVPAVFFVTYDYVKNNPDLVRRMIDEGHTVGNHSWSHPSMPEISAEQAAEQITRLHDYVKENFGYTMTLFRAPKGEFSVRTLEIARQLGYKSVFWSFAYYDYNPNDQPSTDKAFTRVTEAVHGGAIYLLHAVSRTNTDILPEVIDSIRKSGYKLNLKGL